MAIDLLQENENVNNKPLKDFVKMYWQALCPIPKDQNPAWQNTGSKDDSFNNTLNADLYMLSPSMNPQTAVTRNVIVPRGKGILITIMAGEYSKAETSEPIVSEANKDQAGIDNQSLHLELDGSAIDFTTLNKYIIRPNDIGEFPVAFPSPENAIFRISGAGTFDAVAAGRYVWTKPLSPGRHTVRHRGKLHCTPPAIETQYDEDITYNIDVQ